MTNTDRPNFLVPPRLAWIKCRARRYQRAFGVARRLAVWEACLDYAAWVAQPVPTVSMMPGGRMACRFA